MYSLRSHPPSESTTMIRGVQKVDLAYAQLASSMIARDINRDVILEVIRAHQPVSRAELSRLSGLQQSAVAHRRPTHTGALGA